MASLDECETRSDKKGEYYVAVIEQPGREAGEVIAAAVPEIARTFPWPKSMRSGAGRMRWVRPLQRIVCLFDGAVVPFEIEGVPSGNETEGHRLMGRGPFKVIDFNSYAKALKTKGHVLLDAADRRALIAEQAQAVCETAGLELVEDEGLLQEVTGLAEWPVVLLGDMDPAFLDLPPEVIRLSMRVHQKYFAVRDPKTGGLAPHFVVVANQEAPDGGKAIAAGNARVLSARLSDARHFWENDRATQLGELSPRLEEIVFHADIGTMADRAREISELAAAIAEEIGFPRPVARLASVAGVLTKADLVSEMVYEFPELQGTIGGYYARAEADADVLAPPSGEISRADRLVVRGDPNGAKIDSVTSLASLPPLQIDAVADAIANQYRPQGPSDTVPINPVAVCVALSEKFSTLVNFWAINQKPTGSKDPFALRRAALGFVRILLETDLRLAIRRLASRFEAIRAGSQSGAAGRADVDDLLAFFADRLKVHLRDEGHRHDLVDAVFALGEDDLVLIVKRVEALGAFLGHR